MRLLLCVWLIVQRGWTIWTRFDIGAEDGGHLTVRRSDRTSQLPMHGSRRAEASNSVGSHMANLDG